MMDPAERGAYESEIKRAADVALRDPNAFIELFVRDEKNKPIVQAQLHRDMQAEWSRSRYSVTVVPREHGKTTQALPRVAWEIIRDTNLRVKIIAATDGLAVERVGAIAKILAQENVQEHYPWVRFKGSHPKKQFTLQRSATHSIDPTVRGVGILGSETGGRADLIVMDDVVNMRNALTQPASRKRVIDAFFSDYFQMLGPDSRLWYISTPWHDSDLTSFLMTGKETEKKPDIFRRAVTEDLVSPWPERWTQARLQERRAMITSGAFARGFLLRTVSDADAVCQPEWIVEDSSPGTGVVIIGIDPASREHERADYTAISVLEIHEGFALVRDVVRDRMNFPRQMEMLRALRQSEHPQYIAVPVVGTQKWMLDELHKQGFTEAVGVKEVGKKRDRFALLGLRHQQQTLRIAKVGGGLSAGVTAYRDELLGFPAAEHDDTLDAVAFAMSLAEKSHLVEVAGVIDTEAEYMPDRDDGSTWAEIGILTEDDLPDL